MPFDGPTLPDMLAIIPQLLSQHVLKAWGTRGDGIRILRLVNKETSVIALTAVQTCVFDFSTQALPRRLVEHICNAWLSKLGIIALTAEGEGCDQVCSRIQGWQRKNSKIFSQRMAVSGRSRDVFEHLFLSTSRFRSCWGHLYSMCHPTLETVTIKLLCFKSTSID